MQNKFTSTFKNLCLALVLFLASANAFGYDRELHPGDYTQFGSIYENSNGSITFNLIVNNDHRCNDVWDWLRIEAILPDNSRILVLEGDNNHLSGYDFMVDDPNDDINVYFRSNYSFTLNNVYDSDGGDLHIRVTWNNPPLLRSQNNFVLKGRWNACGDDWVGQWTGDEWMRTIYQVYKGHTPQEGTKLGIMQYWAPRVYHDTRDGDVCLGVEIFGQCAGSEYTFYEEQDMISGVNFDGDWNAKNNWENNCHGNNGNPIAPRAYVYSSFVETESHYFLGYHYFHPTDDAEVPADRHENDMEDVYICVRKGSGFGTFEAMLTNSHGDYNKYWGNNLHFTKGHPHIFITSNGIGLADYSGLLGMDDHGHSIYKYDRNSNGDFGGGDGIIYNIGDKGVVPGSCNKRNDGTYPQYTYSLLELHELWSRRFDNTHNPFRGYGSFGGEGDDGKGPGAYVSWKDSELNNPAVKFLEYFPELDDNKEWSTNYLHNPYINGSDGSDAALQYRGALPMGWNSVNVGSPLKNGLVYYANSTFTLEGAGADIWGTYDQFNYVYTNLSGNGEIIARVYSIQENIDVWSKAGVMIRESVNPGSKYAMVDLTSHNGCSFQTRSNTDGNSDHQTDGSLSNPLWLKLKREGDVFTAHYSIDGFTWVQRGGSRTVSMSNDVLIGLAVTSHNADWLCSVTFDNVLVNGSSVKSAILEEGVFNQETANEKQLLLYPNPLKSESLNIELSGFDMDEEGQIQIYNIQGRVIYKKGFVGNETIQLNKSEWFKSGMYLIKCNSGEHQDVKKLIVK